MGEVMAWLRSRLPDDATITNGAGNFSVWAHRFYEFRRYGTQLAPQSGSMGYGVPAAVAAKLVHPDRIVVCIAGDGDFSMTGQELITAVQYGAPVVVLVVDNGMLGTIRMHQERQFPGRVSGDRSRQPGLRGTRPRVRRLRRAGRAGGGLPRGVRARPGRGRARRASSRRRSGDDHAEADDLADPRHVRGRRPPSIEGLPPPIG